MNNNLNNYSTIVDYSRSMKNIKTSYFSQVNLAMSQHLLGHIIRLHVRCENTGYVGLGKETEQMTPTRQDKSEKHCVLIKFSGSFTCK